MHFGLHVKCPLLLSDFNQNWECRQILVELSSVKFNTNPFSLSRNVPCVWTDGQRDSYRRSTWMQTRLPGKLFMNAFLHTDL